MKSPLQIGHWILLFALATLPFAATFTLPYPDERHYTDGALQMLRDHDWLVPKTPAPNTGEWLPRFNKPPLAYWAVAASFKIFGVSVLAARLPFLLACCGTLFLTWRLAKKITGNDATASLAAVILATHVQFIFAATRSIPDSLLVFFVTLSASGFLRLIALKETGAGVFWTAYGGAAGAAMSKGLLGLGIVLFAWAFVFAREKNFNAVKKLLHWPSMALAAAFVAAWFAVILKRHGAAAWHGFFGDQVTDNVQGGALAPLWRAPAYAAILAVNFLPWSLPAIETGVRKIWESRRAALSSSETATSQISRQFILAWCAVLCAGFALGVNVSVRYLLPAAPLAAVFVADILAGAADARLVFSTRRIFIFMLGLLLALDAAALALHAQWGLHPLLLLAAGLFVAMAATLAAGALWRKIFSPAEGLGLAWLLVFPLLFFIAGRVALPDACQQLARTFRNARIDPATPVLFVGRPALASGVRLFLGGGCNLIRADGVNAAAAEKFVVAFVPESQAGELARRGWELWPAAVIAGAPPEREWWTIFKSRALPQSLEDNGQKYFLARRS